MVLDDRTIDDLKIIKEKFDRDNLQPASYDLTLDLDGEVSATLKPHEFRTFSTKEVVQLPGHIGGELKDKSSFMRLGMSITQGWVDPGFEGTLTVGVTNLTDKEMILWNERPFCQIIFLEVKREAENLYCGNYQNQRGVTESVLTDCTIPYLYGEISD